MSWQSLRTLGRFVPHRPGPYGAFVAVAHTAHLVLLHATGAMRLNLAPRTLAMVALSYLTVLGLYFLVGVALERTRWPRVVAWLVLQWVHVILACYVYTTGFSLDYGLVVDNAALAAGEGAWDVMTSIFREPASVATVAVHALATAVFLILEVRRRTMSGAVQGAPLWAKRLVALAAYGALVFLPSRFADEVANLLNGAVRYHLTTPEYASRFPPGTYPLIREAPEARDGSQWRPAGMRLPSVILVMVESLSARFVETTTDDGRPFTPVLNRRLRDGVTVDRFYGTSIQTSKGQFATLFGMLPLVRGKVFTHHPDTRLLSLPEVLRAAGYHTIYAQAYADLGFDATGAMMERSGFDEVFSVAPDLQPEDEPYVWGWGMEDHVFYRRFLQRLDRRLAADPAPVFVTLATVSNHMRFSVPPQRRELFPEPSTLFERYANSVHLADASLDVLFRELAARPALRDAVVIVTGDHSFPTGAHGIEHNEHGFYEESFRTPFLLTWPGHLPPRRIPDPAASQIDIAPTLVDLLGLPLRRHHFQGRSLLSDPPAPVLLLQPYNGTYLGAIIGHTKYLRRQRTGEEMAFDLAADPAEDHNILGSLEPRLRSQLRDAVERLLETSYLLSADQVWDGQNAGILGPIARP